MSNRLYNAAIFNEAVYKPMKLMTNPVVVIAGILLAALLLASTFSVSAQEAKSYRINENSTDPVDTFAANRAVKWTLSGTDAADFKISDDGVLTFAKTPNFEKPADGDANNIYLVNIVATTDGISATLVNATITVLNVDDPGKVTLDHLQPAEDVEFKAVVADEDDGQKLNASVDNTLNPASQYVAWKWEKSQSGTSGSWVIITGETGQTYTPATADVGYYLQATATYSNRTLDSSPVANAPIRTASARSSYPVKATTNVNQSPAFPDDKTLTPDNTTDNQLTRDVDENDKNALVGGAVTAKDAGDVLQYSWTNTDGDEDEFNLDKATGQISVKGTLDHEDSVDPDGIRVVNITATDPFRATDTVTVTITVNDLNDAPKFEAAPGGGSTRGVVAENVDTSDADNPVSPSDDPDTTGETEAFDYGATDEDQVGPAGSQTSEAVTYHLGGADAKVFQIVEATGVLTFKKDTKINYEKKKSYSVTVIAKDARGKTAERDVTIKVTNQEDTGKITLSTRQPQVGVPITASLSDEDGIKGSIKWQWGTTGTSTCPTAFSSDTFSPIDNDRAKKPTFTPTAADVNTNSNAFAANCIGVTATYKDGFETADDVLTQGAANPALPKRQANRPPQFKNEDGDVITSTTRSVDEDDTMVGKPVSAIDPDDSRGSGPDGDPNLDLADHPTYSLHGADAASFTINSGTGQITAKANTLDYETKQKHNVTVRATDGSRASTNISVTITVNDVNEVPKVSGPAAVTYAENGTDAVGTYTAADPENDAVVWSLDGADKGSFSISDGGALSFKSSPNYDKAGDTGKNNMYEVTVVATDTVDGVGKKNVEVTVTNVDDAGSISFDVVQPGVGVETTATLTDEDTADEAGSATWQWASGDSGSGPFTAIENATSTTYTPVTADAGKYLQATASYGADDDPKSVSGVFGHATAAVDVANAVPVFPDMVPATKDVEAGDTDQERQVAENSKAGTAVGAPVKAEDDDVLTYSLLDAANTDTEGMDSQYFTIDKASGQIKVSAAGADGTQLNYEGAPTVNRYVVRVRATDANAATADVKVTIIVTDVNEKPKITTPSGFAADNVFEAAENGTVIDADGTVGGTLVAATYTATDQDADENSAVTWSVEGADGDKFKITAGTSDGNPTGTLAFKKNPDYEAKGSAAGTNEYKVTVVATDPAGNRATKNAKVNVTNVNEPGKITLSTVQPQVGVLVMATLSDPDGVVGTPSWTWNDGGTEVTNGKANFTPRANTQGSPLSVSVTYKDAEAGATGDNQTVADANISSTYNIRGVQTSNKAPVFEDDEGKKITSTTREIKENNVVGEATSNVDRAVQATDPNGTATVNHLTYTLGGADADSFKIDRGDPADGQAGSTTVKATAGQITAKKSLDYETKSVYTVTVTAKDGSGASATISVVINVLDVEPEPPKLAAPNKAPEFAEATYELEVAEGTTPGRNVGDAVAATDEDEDDTLSYSLSGDDAESFAIDGNGQITTNAALVMATKGTYTLTVTVDDGNKGTASAKVTITITAAPPPVFDDGESASRSIAENSAAGSSVGDPVTATVPEGDVLYALGGDDAGSFEIDINTGQITTGEGTTLDFESGATSYSVTVTATNATGGQASIDVAIGVENVNEAGTLTVSPDQAELGVRMTASVSDPDGGVTGESWEWQWSETGATWSAIPGGRSASYTPSESDGGLLIRVMVEYSDASGEESELASPATGLPPVPEPPAPEPTPVPPAPTPTPVPPAPTPTPVPPTATPVPPTATPVPPAPTATPVPPAPTATPVPEDEGGFPAWLVVVIVLGLAAVIAAGVLVVRNRQQQQ